MLLNRPRALCALEVLAVAREQPGLSLPPALTPTGRVVDRGSPPQVMALEWHENMVPKHTGATPHLTYMMTNPFCNITMLGWH